MTCPFLSPGLTVSIPGLERALHQYTLEPSEKPFDLKSVPLATAPIVEQRTGEEQTPKPWSRPRVIPEQLQPSDSRLQWACWELLSSILFEFVGITSSVKTKASRSGCSHVNCVCLVQLLIVVVTGNPHWSCCSSKGVQEAKYRCLVGSKK